MSFLSYSPSLATPNGAALSHNYQAVNTARSDHLTNLLMLAEKKTSIKDAGTTSYFSAAITPTAITHHCNFKQTYINDTIIPVPTHLLTNKKNGANNTYL